MGTSVFSHPWWGLEHFPNTSSSVYERCLSFFLSLLSSSSPMVLSSLQVSVLLNVLTIHSVVLVLMMLLILYLVDLLYLLHRKQSNTNTTLLQLSTHQLFQVLMYTVLHSMPSLP